MARKSKAKAEEYRIQLPAVIPPPPPEPPPTDRWGRPTKFKPEYVDMARTLCEEGATDKELADFFDVHRSTIYEWRLSHPEFADVCKLGKDLADDRMERTAYEVAMGYVTTVREAIKVRNADGSEVVQLVEKEVVIKPDPDMLKWMLKNRRPDKWRDKVEHAHTGEIVHLTRDQMQERIEAKLAAIRQRQSGETGV